MNAQENKDFIQNYLEALSGKPKPPELVDQYVSEQPLKDHITMNEAAFMQQLGMIPSNEDTS